MAAFRQARITEITESGDDIVRGRALLEDGTEVDVEGYPRMLGPLEAGDSVHDAYLKTMRARADKAGLWLELSVPSRYLESPEAYAEMAGVASHLGGDRIRVAQR